MNVPNLSDIEISEVQRIVSQRVGSTFIISDKDMCYVIEMYIKSKKAKRIRIDPKKGLSPEAIMYYPGVLKEEFLKLNAAYSVALNYFSYD